jgi:hypothetical protein
MTPDDIRKYRHVKARVTSGTTEGERAAARAILQKMAREHTGIAIEAARAEREEAEAAAPGRQGGFTGAAPPPGFDNVWNFLQGAAREVRAAYSREAEALALAEAIETSSDITRRGRGAIVITITIDEDATSTFLDTSDPALHAALAEQVAEAAKLEFLALCAA